MTNFEKQQKAIQESKQEDLSPYYNVVTTDQPSIENKKFSGQLNQSIETISNIDPIDPVNLLSQREQQENQNNSIQELEQPQQKNLAIKLLQKAQKKFNQLFQIRSEQEWKSIETIHNKMIKSVIDRLSVTINNQKVENVYEDKQLSKLRSEINKTVSSYSQTLYDFQVAAGVIQKGDSFDINNTMFLKKQGDDPKHPGYKKISFSEAVQKQIDLLIEKFQVDSNTSNNIQKFLEPGQSVRVKSYQETNQEKSTQEDNQDIESATTDEETSTPTNIEISNISEIPKNLSEQSYISIKKIINFLYNSIDNINDNTKLDKTLQSIRFSINAHLINVTEGSAFDYIQNSVIKPLKKLQDLNKGTNISNPTTIKNYLKIYAKKLEKIQDPTIQKTREKNIINIDAIKINKLINTTQEILISLKTDLKNLSQTNSQTVEQLKILQTEFTYSTQQITNDEQIFERFNKKIQQIIDNGQKTSPTLLAVDLSIAHSILSKSKQTLKPQPTIIESSEPINQPQNNIEDLREAIVIESDSPKNESGFDENVVMESELNSPQTSYQIQETINPIENQDTDNTEFIVESIRNNIKHINNEIQNNSHILYVIFQDEINPDLSVKFNILGRDINATLKKELETQIISDYNYNLGQFDTPIGHYNLDNLGTNDWQPKEMQRVIAAYEKLSQQFTKESLVALEIPHFETDQEELQVNAQDKSEEEVTQSLASQTSKESETPAKESIQKDDTPNQDNTDGSSEEIAQSKSESPKIMKRSNLAKIPGKLENFKAEMVAAQQRLAAKDIDINIDELESSIASTHQFLMDKSILLDSGNYRNEYLLIPKFQKLAQENNYQTTERDGKRFINKEKYFELQLIDMNNYVHSQQNQTSKTIIKNVERPKSTQKEKPITNQSSNSNSNSGFTIDNDAFMNALNGNNVSDTADYDDLDFSDLEEEMNAEMNG